ncbi:MAG: hypothetical protein Q7K57_19130 [Burkholderiaceae bacterium]|nr:hypothetical protein [Burkholderiaceae bacterium]
MTALSKPFNIATTPSTAKPKATKNLPVKSVPLKTKPIVAVKVTSKSPAAKSTAKVASTSPVKPLKSEPDNQTTKLAKVKKIKLVRDSFTIPKPEYLVLDDLKLRAADLKHPIKKGELLRAGIKALAAMTDTQLQTALQAVPALKTGRPSK